MGRMWPNVANVAKCGQMWPMWPMWPIMAKHDSRDLRHQRTSRPQTSASISRHDRLSNDALIVGGRVVDGLSAAVGHDAFVANVANVAECGRMWPMWPNVAKCGLECGLRDRARTGILGNFFDSQKFWFLPEQSRAASSSRYTICRLRHILSKAPP